MVIFMVSSRVRVEFVKVIHCLLTSSFVVWNTSPGCSSLHLTKLLFGFILNASPIVLRILLLQMTSSFFQGVMLPQSDVFFNNFIYLVKLQDWSLIHKNLLSSFEESEMLISKSSFLNQVSGQGFFPSLT